MSKLIIKPETWQAVDEKADEILGQMRDLEAAYLLRTMNGAAPRIVAAVGSIVEDIKDIMKECILELDKEFHPWEDKVAEFWEGVQANGLDTDKPDAEAEAGRVEYLRDASGDR